MHKLGYSPLHYRRIVHWKYLFPSLLIAFAFVGLIFSIDDDNTFDWSNSLQFLESMGSVGLFYALNVGRCKHQLADVYDVKAVLAQTPRCTTKLVEHKDTHALGIARIENDQHLSILEVHQQQRMAAEVATRLRGQPNFMQLLGTACTSNQQVQIWSPCPGTALGTHTLYPGRCHDKTADEVRTIIRRVHAAIQALLPRGIKHRDLWRGNMMYDATTKRVCIIDYHLSNTYPVTYLLATTNATQDMERLLYEDITGSQKMVVWFDDILSLGSLMAHLLSVPGPGTEIKYWHQLVQLLGKDELLLFLDEHDLIPSANVMASIEVAPSKRVDWRIYRNECNKDLLTADAIDFLDGLFQYSYKKRLEFFLTAPTHRYLQQQQL